MTKHTLKLLLEKHPAPKGLEEQSNIWKKYLDRFDNWKDFGIPTTAYSINIKPYEHLACLDYKQGLLYSRIRQGVENFPKNWIQTSINKFFYIPDNNQIKTKDETIANMNLPSNFKHLLKYSLKNNILPKYEIEIPFLEIWGKSKEQSPFNEILRMEENEKEKLMINISGGQILIWSNSKLDIYKQVKKLRSK